MTLITRRSLLAGSAVTLCSQAQPPAVILVGEVIIWLFAEVLKIGIEALFTSAAKYIWSHYLKPRTPETAHAYVESAHAADNFCAYCTVEYARKGRVFWDGALFQPNEDNNFYRSQGKPTDQMLLDILTSGEWLWHLDLTRNRNAHMSGTAIDEIRRSVQQLQNDKTHLYHELEGRALPIGGLRRYMIQKPVLDELDKAYRHVTSKDPRDYHINPRYVDSVLVLQKYVTWFNTKLSAVEMATFRSDLFA